CARSRGSSPLDYW
nr:immunoglobulin heavy chain junction region [Mus musculus]MBK4195757.1 immunoglobulin heavy chain junction region [Mus musculus]MBK4195758.1 immunoglobulin heavy chain junction region [Mus musculus]MBK4195760.1 immunoglobulin heavy chain junction region [Mus musculus]